MFKIVKTSWITIKWYILITFCLCACVFVCLGSTDRYGSGDRWHGNAFITENGLATGRGTGQRQERFAAATSPRG